MIDIKKIVNDKEMVLENLSRRGKDYTDEINLIEENYNKYLEALKVEEQLKGEINKISKEIGILKSENKEEEANKIIISLDSKKKKIFQSNSKKYKNEYENLLMRIPNLISGDVPIGQDENDNKVVRSYGGIPEFDFVAVDHYNIKKVKKNFCFQKAHEISKSRFIITKGFLAKLERALTNFMLDTHSNIYEEVAIPFIVSEETLKVSSQLPKFANDLFKLEKTTKSEENSLENKKNLFLIPTAEVVLANLHREEIISSQKFPLSYMAFSQCFRKEAGSAGRDTSGLIRMHQFGKVELFKYTSAEKSDQELEYMLADATNILKKLRLHYRVVKLCSGDIGFSAMKTYDLEVWFPGQNKYRECASISNVGDFQARRGKIRYKNKNGKKEFVHMLNGSGMATGRVLAAILENFQTKEGEVEVPLVLLPYMK